MKVTPEAAAAHRDVGGNRYYFCSTGCAADFDADPDRYITARRQGSP
jgi:Cu+-exporting ATPase